MPEMTDEADAMPTLLLPAGVLADRADPTRPRAVPAWAWDAVLVLAAALLTALSARIVVPLPFTPVPVTGQTFAVLLTAAALGPWRGMGGQALYIGLGLIGLPFYSGGASGWEILSGATGGYLVGFVVAGGIVGALSRLGWDRRFWTAALSMTIGTVVIFAFGVAWLAVVKELSFGNALAAGLYPFIAGGVMKIALAAGLLPAAWRAVG